jgi:hypothetical protein
MLHLLHDFVVSSYFIEVPRDEDVDLEMPKILGRF